MSEQNNSNSNQNNNNNQNNNTKKRDFILDGTVSEETTRKLAERIIEINRYDDEQYDKDSSYIAHPIKIIVNTYGGSVYDGNMLVAVIETSTTPVYTYSYGKTMSMGIPIFLAGHRRYATPFTWFMYHDMSSGLMGTIEEMKVGFEQCVELRDMMDSYVLSKCNIPKSLMDEKKRLKEDLYITAHQAFMYGMVDEIIEFPRKRK